MDILEKTWKPEILTGILSSRSAPSHRKSPLEDARYDRGSGPSIVLPIEYCRLPAIRVPVESPSDRRDSSERECAE